MAMSELEQRITRLEDIEAIKQLKARYCEICDDMHNPQQSHPRSLPKMPSGRVRISARLRAMRLFASYLVNSKTCSAFPSTTS